MAKENSESQIVSVEMLLKAMEKLAYRAQRQSTHDPSILKIAQQRKWITVRRGWASLLKLGRLKLLDAHPKGDHIKWRSRKDNEYWERGEGVFVFAPVLS